MPEFWFFEGKMMNLEQVKEYKARKESSKLAEVEPIHEVEEPIESSEPIVEDSVPSLDDVLPVTSLLENEEEVNNMSLVELRSFARSKGLKFSGQPGREKLITLLTQKQ
jgi:hypothetical protein